MAFNNIPVHLKNGEQLKESYFKTLNSMKQVPTLLIDNEKMTQSTAMLEYLEESRKNVGARLLPDDKVLRSKVREICQIIGSGIQPIQNLSVMKKIVGIVKRENPNKKEMSTDDRVQTMFGWGKLIIEEGFDGLEPVLSKSAGMYCVGDNVTMADLFLIPQVYNARRFGVDMNKYPTITRVDRNCNKLDAFIRAHPDNQPDCPNKAKL